MSKNALRVEWDPESASTPVLRVRTDPQVPATLAGRPRVIGGSHRRRQHLGVRLAALVITTVDCEKDTALSTLILRLGKHDDGLPGDLIDFADGFTGSEPNRIEPSGTVGSGRTWEHLVGYN